MCIKDNFQIDLIAQETNLHANRVNANANFSFIFENLLVVNIENVTQESNQSCFEYGIEW